MRFGIEASRLTSSELSMASTRPQLSRRRWKNVPGRMNRPCLRAKAYLRWRALAAPHCWRVASGRL